MNAQDSLEGLPPELVTVLIVDFQNEFCHPAACRPGGPANAHNAETALRANAFARRAAAAGARVLYTRQEFDPEQLTPRQRHWDEALKLCPKGSWQAELFIEPVPGAEVVVKHRFDVWQSEQFQAYLERTPVEGFVIAGVELSCCVLFAVLGTDERGYRLTVPQDLVSGLDEGDTTYNRAVRELLRHKYHAPASAVSVLQNWEALPRRS